MKLNLRVKNSFSARLPFLLGGLFLIYSIFYFVRVVFNRLLHVFYSDNVRMYINVDVGPFLAVSSVALIDCDKGPSDCQM